jgi:UDP-N-acetylenolpyruvoylglucosamine reductase
MVDHTLLAQTASWEDIQKLCDAVKKDVGELFGIELEPEVNFI